MRIIEIVGRREEAVLLEVENTLKSGGVVIVPTDTVYGLICEGLTDRAKERIYGIKGRSKDKPLIGFVNTLEKVKSFAEVSAEREIILKQNWPGAKTYLLKAIKDIYLVTAKTGKIAFRIPAHEFLLNILERFDLIASTSANISGEKASLSVADIPDVIREEADVIIDGGRLCGKPSDIWDITGDSPLRLR